MTAAQVRNLGIAPTPPTPQRPRVRKVAHGRYHTRCTECGEHFLIIANETRHLAATGHHRYELTWGDPPIPVPHPPTVDDA